VLSGGATGSAVQPLYGNASTPYDASHLFIAIDIAHFGDRSKIRAAATAAAERIRASARAPGVTRLFTPGEPEWARRESAAGRVLLPPTVADTLRRLAKELRVPADALMPSEKYERT
jgi:LDH2 family malate/lactate/ureidoglycolate dehydrogenase